MKQRVKLAQALVGDPRLLLLDEPTNGLDPAGRNAMLELIERIGAEFGISIVVASHLLGEIERICDHLVAIEAGRLLRADTIDSFTRASQTLLIEVEEGLAALQRELDPPRPAARPLPAQPAGAHRRRRAPTTRSATASPTLGLPLAGWSSAGTRSRSCSATRPARPARPAQRGSDAADTSAETGGPARSARAASSTTSATGATTARGSAGAQIVAALAWHSFRAAFGFGRGAKAKIVPVIAFVALCLPAVVNAFAMSRGNAAAGRLRHLRRRRCATWS